LNENMGKEILIGKRIKLVPISMDGLHDMHDYSTMTEFFKFFEYEPFKSIDDTKNYLERLIIESNSNETNFWFIEINGKKIIGTFGIVKIDKRRKSAELKFGISPKYWNQGYFSEAMELVLKNLFQKLDFHRIVVLTHADNAGAIKGLINAGFQREGMLRDYLLYKNGERFDVIIFSILKNEFSNRIQ